MRDNLARPVIDWEEKHQSEPDISKFFNEIVTRAISETIVRNLGWEDQGCNVSYESKFLKDSLVQKTMISREKAAWMLGLIALSWLTKIIQGKIDVGHCWTHKKQTGKPCEWGRKFHVKIAKQMAQNLREMADIVDCVN